MTTALLPKEICEQIDQWIQRYPADQKQSGVFEALRLVQEKNNGSLTVPLMDAVAAYLGMAAVDVYGVATFYSMYRMQPVGRHVIELCNNVSCQLNGSEALLTYLQQRLGIALNETTADGQFTLREVECLGACIAPPVCQIGKQYYENLTPEKLNEMIERLQHGK
ncbi:MAG TPA: NAD(P)H-dependent oxidoreductase subunit E [Gammaproteobacteria bacterium]|jgi:NADH-quinone oxidoreductase subunit E|nr:NAD(P)H-dependent oxidoreductase subunit E [Gammaproteobacteria bacterium]